MNTVRRLFTSGSTRSEGANSKSGCQNVGGELAER